jgi:hypothetical protein
MRIQLAAKVIAIEESGGFDEVKFYVADKHNQGTISLRAFPGEFHLRQYLRIDIVRPRETQQLRADLVQAKRRELSAEQLAQRR